MTCKKQILGSINGLPDILAFLDGQASGTTNVTNENVDGKSFESIKFDTESVVHVRST